MGFFAAKSPGREHDAFKAGRQSANALRQENSALRDEISQLRARISRLESELVNTRGGEVTSFAIELEKRTKFVREFGSTDEALEFFSQAVKDRAKASALNPGESVDSWRQRQLLCRDVTLMPVAVQIMAAVFSTTVMASLVAVISSAILSSSCTLSGTNFAPRRLAPRGVRIVGPFSLTTASRSRPWVRCSARPRGDEWVAVTT